MLGCRTLSFVRGREADSAERLDMALATVRELRNNLDSCLPAEECYAVLRMMEGVMATERQAMESRDPYARRPDPGRCVTTAQLQAWSRAYAKAHLSGQPGGLSRHSIAASLAPAEAKAPEPAEVVIAAPVAVNPEASRLFRSLEPRVNHLSLKHGTLNYSVIKFQDNPELALTEEQRRLIMSLNKPPWHVARLHHNRQAVSGDTGEAVRPTNTRDMLFVVRVIIGQHEYIHCQCEGKNCQYLTFYRTSDIRRWKFLSEETIADMAVLHYTELKKFDASPPASPRPAARPRPPPPA
jgi:hypothetical protein